MNYHLDEFERWWREYGQHMHPMDKMTQQTRDFWKQFAYKVWYSARNKNNKEPIHLPQAA